MYAKITVKKKESRIGLVFVVVGRGRQRKTVLRSKNLLRFIKIWDERKASKLNKKKCMKIKLRDRERKE